MTPTTIFVADVHLDIQECERIRHFERFLLDMHRRGHTIYIMGDLFNFWAGNTQSFLPTLRPFIRTLYFLARSRRTFFLSGNRDFLFAPFFQKRLGGPVIYDGASIELGGMKILLYHGDDLCRGDINYQRMKRWLHSKTVYYLSCLLPTFACVKIGMKFRNISQNAIREKKQEEMGLSDGHIAQILGQKEADVLICGHVHKQHIRHLQVAGTLRKVYVLPPCDGEQIGYLIWKSGALVFEQY